MPTPTVSVVIPCYNDGQFLQEAVDSVVASSYRSIEIIIVNDGSTDSNTLLQFDKLATAGHTVIHQPNMGQCSARNNGITHAVGPYILSLDADNKVRSHYIELAVGIMEKDASIGVVYGKYDRFGSRSERNIGQPFDPLLLLFRGCIDTLAVYRKSAWQAVSGYDTQLKGNEDWDFWLTLHEHGTKFHFIDDVVFDYRVKENSVSTFIKQKKNQKEFWEYFSTKHATSYRQGYVEIYIELMLAKSNPIKFILKQRMVRTYALVKRWKAAARNFYSRFL
jgi:glycosyltransferase involved in cell wall biosynthesis